MFVLADRRRCRGPLGGSDLARSASGVGCQGEWVRAGGDGVADPHETVAAGHRFRDRDVPYVTFTPTLTLTLSEHCSILRTVFEDSVTPTETTATNETTASAPPETPTTPRDRRHAETRGEILAAAWELARRDGLLSISLRELGRDVGLKASSLYSYFDSKGALFDAMFRQGYVELLAVADEWVLDESDPQRSFADANRHFARFCCDDPVRYQLLFQRTLPEWEPSAESYTLAVTYLDRLRSALATIGITDERAVDLWTAIITGLTSQQVSNDLGGDRWLRLVDDAVAMFFAHFAPSQDPSPEGST